MMDNLPLYYTCLLGVGYDIDESFFSLDEQLYSMIPIYSTRGGYGANITCFTAINANTEHIEDAVFMLDYFLSEEFQRSELFSHITLGNSVPILEGLMQENTSCVGHDNEQWFMLSENYKEFCNLRDKIAYAELSTPLELDIRQLYSDSKTCNDDETLRSMVHKTYIQMNMKLAES